MPYVGVRRARTAGRGGGSGEMHVVVVDVDARTVATSAPCTVHAQLATHVPPHLPVLYVDGPVPRSLAPSIPRE